MRVFRGTEDVPSDFAPSAVTIGKFDGVHGGHRAVIAQLRAVAAERGLGSVAVTFDRHPFALHRPDVVPSALVGLDQKLELLAETGLDVAVVLTYDEQLASLTPRQFVEIVLVDSLHAHAVLVGSDFRFGLNNSGDVDTLRQLGSALGCEVVLIDDVALSLGDEAHDARRVSSTWIRELLERGDVAEARRLLGHVPTVRAVVVHGAKRGRELGFPTANLSADSSGYIPADGVYAGWLRDGNERYPAAISVGDNPTFVGVPRKQVEAHVLDHELDLYGHTVDVEFVERIRGMVAYAGVEPLIEQIARDVSDVRDILAVERSE